MTKAMVLASRTSMVGLGSFMGARHAGIVSLGLRTTVSFGGSLLAALLVFPSVFRLFPAGSAQQ